MTTPEFWEMLQPDDAHCVLCFDTVVDRLHSAGSINPSPTDSGPLCPMFVTWKHSQTDRLRGCIGTFAPVELWSGLRKYAIVSAFQDPRFFPLQSKELASLSVTVSLLDAFQECSDWDDWEVGQHGVQMTYASKYSSTFLPEVAAEQGWTKAQTVQQLLAKAGYTKRDYDPELLAVTRYESRKHSLSFSNYENHKNKIVQ